MPKFEPNDPVIIHAPSFYREHRVGIVIGPCKDHENAYRVRVLEKEAPIKEVCVNEAIGDTIVMLSP